MIIEVFQKGRTVGFVVAKNKLEASDLIAKTFPQVDKVNITHSLPKHDERCKPIANNVYAWVA